MSLPGHHAGRFTDETGEPVSLPGDESVGRAEYGIEDRCPENPVEQTHREVPAGGGQRPPDRPVPEMVLPAGPEDRMVTQAGRSHINARRETDQGLRAALAEAAVPVIEEDHAAEGSPPGP